MTTVQTRAINTRGNGIYKVKAFVRLSTATDAKLQALAEQAGVSRGILLRQIVEQALADGASN